MVPNGWKLTSLGEVCSGNLQTGPFGSQLHAHEYTDEGVPVLMPKDLINYRANNESAAKIPEHRADDLKKHTLQSGDLLFSRRGDVARFALIESDYPRSLCGTGCLKATPNKAHSPLFLSYFLQKNAVKKWLEQNAVGQTMPNMNTAILAELPLMIASSREEEDKIAQILSTWDKAISTTEKLIETSKQQKKALMQQLLTGKKRLVSPETGKAFDGDWNSQPISSLITESRIAGTNGELARKLTVKLYGRGVTQKEEKRLGSSSTKYYKRKSGQFIYSKLDFLNGAFGIIPEHLDGFESTLDLPAFDFSEAVEPNWFIEFVSRDDFYTSNLGLANGGRKARRVNPKDLLQIKVRVPSLKEQQKIASVLTAADKETKVLEAKLAHFKQEKKALMQQLLTGKRRVKVEEMEVA